MKRLFACLASVMLVVGLLPMAAWGVGLRVGEAPSDQPSSEWTPAETTAQAQALASLCNDFTASRVGIGGNGALFHPLISPFDHDTIIVSCDMGGLYVSHDAGSNWKAFSCAGRVLTTTADPSTPGVFYAGGSGLWRSTDNGTSWNLLWPKPENAQNNVQSSLGQSRTFYFTSALDSYPDQNVVLAVCIDPSDSDHIATVCAAGIGGYVGVHCLYESFDGGESFQLSARFNVSKKPKDTSLENMRVFIEPATGVDAATAAFESRVLIVVPDGLLALDRTAANPESAMHVLYAAPETIQDAAQVFEGGQAHYVVLENLADTPTASVVSATSGATGEQDVSQVTSVALWHATLTESSAAPTLENIVDLTSEMTSSLPRKYNSKKDGTGTDYEIVKHDAVTLCAPSLERIYLGYRSRNLTNPSGESWQGVSGLVVYDASRAQGERFEWVYGHRCFWNREDAGKRVAANQNHIMSHLASRGHVNANFTMLGLAADPRDAQRIVLTTHTGLFYSPNIDADVGLATKVDYQPRVNIYARYAVLCEQDPTNGNRASNQNEYRMRSTGLEVTVTNCVRTDPFDGNHVIMCMDDAGIAHSYDGGQTWSHFYTKLPKIGDCCFDAVFDEGREGVVYGAWDQKGAGTYLPRERFFEGKSVFALSTDGGVSWNESYSSGLPANATVVKMAVSYPRDAAGMLTDAERTIYVATMGYGFYVSYDSGKNFVPMNVGVPAVSYTTGGVEYQSIWARDFLVTDDGRLFGMTQYSTLGPQVNGSSTRHSTQDARTFGNVWEWDRQANNGEGAWVKLPFNYAGAHSADSVDVRQPRRFAYDSNTRTLYVAAVSVIGSNISSGRWSNFGGGLYAYTSAASDASVGSGTVTRLDAPICSSVCGDNLVAVSFDASGRLWIASEDGDVYFRNTLSTTVAGSTIDTLSGIDSLSAANSQSASIGRSANKTSSIVLSEDSGSGWTQVFANALRICEGFDFDTEGNVYLSTHGMGALRFHPQPLSQTTPSQEQTTPSQEQTTPGQEQITPGQSQTQPGKGQTTSGQNQQTLNQNQPASEQGKPTPEQEESTLNAGRNRSKQVQQDSGIDQTAQNQVSTNADASQSKDVSDAGQAKSESKHYTQHVSNSDQAQASEVQQFDLIMLWPVALIAGLALLLALVLVVVHTRV